MWCKIVLVLIVFGLNVFASEDDASIASVEDFRISDDDNEVCPFVDFTLVSRKF